MVVGAIYSTFVVFIGSSVIVFLVVEATLVIVVLMELNFIKLKIILN